MVRLRSVCLVCLHGLPLSLAAVSSPAFIRSLLYLGFYDAGRRVAVMASGRDSFRLA